MTNLIPSGWPCALLPANPPSVADRLAAPGADDILPQLLQLTPRGAVWGTDEAGPADGANAVMLQVWRAIAGHAAANYAIDFDLAMQGFPSGITWSLPDWEAEYGLPDPCLSGTAGTQQRINAVRARYAAQGGQSPAYFICLAASIGYDITIEEPTQFLVDDGECVGEAIVELWFTCDDGACDDTPLEAFALVQDVDDGNEVSDETVWKYWVVHVGSLGETYFLIDEGALDFDPLEGFSVAADLECELRRYCPPHTRLVFDYSALH